MPRGDIPHLPEEIVTHPDQLAACCAHLAERRLFGFDTEFVGEDSYRPHLCLIQVATTERLFLIDPLSAGPLDAFWQQVVDPANRVIVHAGREEVRLCHLAIGKIPANLVDLQLAAGLVGLVYPIGHGSLVNQLLGIQLCKMETLTEWRERPLTRQQIRYAFDDVRFLLPLWQRLEADLRGLDRLGWAEEEFGRLTVHATNEEAIVEKWRKLRGLGSLDRLRLAVVRELFRWREERAAQLNRPPRTLIRDDLLIEIARRNPRRERDLEVIRGLPRKNLDALVAVVERARALPPEEMPRAIEREQDPPQLGLAGDVLSAVLNDFCTRRRLASNLAATGNDIKLLIRARMQGRSLEPDASLLAQGWRRNHVLPELEGVLNGKRVVRIADLRREAPLEISPASGGPTPP